VNVYPFIEAEKGQQRNVKRSRELLKVSRAAFYAHLSGASQRQRQDAELPIRIRAVHKDSRGRYGAPRVHAELRRHGHRHGRKRVARLMRQAGARGTGPEAMEEDHHSLTRRRLLMRTGSGGTSPPTPASSTPAGAATSPTSAPGKGGCSWPPSSTSPPAAS
jgi:HTH-like domain